MYFNDIIYKISVHFSFTLDGHFKWLTECLPFIHTARAEWANIEGGYNEEDESQDETKSGERFSASRRTGCTLLVIIIGTVINRLVCSRQAA